MQDDIDANRQVRPRPTFLLVAAALLSGMIVTGCGGSSPSPTSPRSSPARRSATTAHSSNTTSDRATKSDSTELVAYRSGPLGFAKCMRANGVPHFPDPNPSGGFEFYAGDVDPSSPAFKAAQAKCRKLLPDGGPPGPDSTTHPSPQTVAKLVRIAQCMREHGVHQFPDPKTSVPSNPAGYQEIIEFDGAILAIPSTVHLQAPAYKHALTACGGPPLGLPH